MWCHWVTKNIQPLIFNTFFLVHTNTFKPWIEFKNLITWRYEGEGDIHFIWMSHYSDDIIEHFSFFFFYVEWLRTLYFNLFKFRILLLFWLGVGKRYLLNVPLLRKVKLIFPILLQSLLLQSFFKKRR